MPKVVRSYTPPRGEQGSRSSIALECDHCKTITWGWANSDRFHCRRCGLTFFHRAGAWVLRCALPRPRKELDPKERPKKKPVNPGG